MADDKDIAGTLNNIMDAVDQQNGADGPTSAERERIGQNVNNSSLYGVGKPKVKATLEGTEKTRLANKTKIIAEIWYKLKKKFEPDVKGKTTVAKRKTKEAKEVKEKDQKGKGKGILGMLLGGLGALLTGKFGLKGILKLLGKGVWGLLKLIVKGIWGAVKLAFKGIGWLFSKMFKGFKNSKIWKGLTKGLAAGKDAIKNIFLSVKGKIGSALRAIGGFFRTIFSKIPGMTKLFPALAAGAGAKAGVKGSAAAAKAAEAAAKKKAAGKLVGKTVKKGFFKSLLKKIPVVGAIAGVGFGIARAMKGDFAGAAAEVASGVASTVPGIGTAASVGIDAALIARDVAKAGKVNDGFISKSGVLTRIDDTDQVLAFAEKGPVSKWMAGNSQKKIAGTGDELSGLWQDHVKKTDTLMKSNRSIFTKSLSNLSNTVSLLGKGISTVAQGFLGTDAIINGIKTSNQHLANLVRGFGVDAIIDGIKTSNQHLANLVRRRDPIKEDSGRRSGPADEPPVIGRHGPEFTAVWRGGDSIGGTVAKLQLSQQKLSNTHLKRLVQLTGELLKKDAGGQTSIIPAVAGALPENNDITGDMSGPTYSDSHADFYNSAYSMHMA